MLAHFLIITGKVIISSQDLNDSERLVNGSCRILKRSIIQVEFGRLEEPQEGLTINVILYIGSCIELLLIQIALVHQGPGEQSRYFLEKELGVGFLVVLYVDDVKVGSGDVGVKGAHEERGREVLGGKEVFGLFGGDYDHLEVVEILNYHLEVLLNLHY